MRHSIALKISGALALALAVLALTLWASLDRFSVFEASFEQIAHEQLPDLLMASELEQETARLLALIPDVLQPRGAYLFLKIKELIGNAAARAQALTEKMREHQRLSPQAEQLARQYQHVADHLLALISLGEQQQATRIGVERLYRRLGELQNEVVDTAANGPVNTEWRLHLLRPLADLFAARETGHPDLIRDRQSRFQHEIAAAGAALEDVPAAWRETAGLIYAEVREHGLGAENLFDLRIREVDLLRQIASRLDDGKLAINVLLVASRQLHESTRQATQQEEAEIREGLQQIRFSLLLLAGFALLAFVAIHLFVRRSVIRRIVDLRQAMQANVGDNPQPIPVPVRGHDELSDMAQAVNYFIDEISRREAALKQAAQQATEASRAKGDFLANISHEIRTPLNAVLNLTGLCLQGALDTHQRKLLEKVERASSFLLELINEILDFSKIEADRIELEHVPFRLAELTEGLDIYADEAAQKGLSFRVDIDAATPAVLCGDPLRIQQVLRNLVGNAIKFTHVGGVEVQIHAAEREGERVWLEFAVKDTGIGIAPDKLALIFEPFSQADTSTTRLFGGTGLGLAISLRLARRMTGELEVKSAAGLGSLFRFRLPLHCSSADAALAEQRLQLRLHPQEDLAPLRGHLALIVEDNEFNQVVALELLERAQMEIDLACDGEEALDMARREDYEVILMDIQMPKMDGYQASRAIRALPRHQHTPIIALTANALAETLSRCREAGMDDLITKPIVPARFYSRLIYWLIERDQEVAALELPEPSPHWETQPRLDPALRPLFAEHYRGFAARFQQTQQQGDAEQAQRLAHNLKSAAGTIGEQRLYQQAMELETRLRNTHGGDWSAELSQEMLTELARVLGEIEG